MLEHVGRSAAVRRALETGVVLRVARAVLGGQCSDIGVASGVEDPQDVAAVAS